MAPPPDAVAPGRQRVLLVDDNPDNVALLLLFMEDAPYRLETAGNGREAVDLHAARPYDLIFMDLEMPFMDGYEATKAIRAQERQSGAGPVPILALTAHALGEHRQRCRQAGFTDFLVKPVRRATILAALTKFLDRPTSHPEVRTPPADQPSRERLGPILPLFFTTSEQALAAADLALRQGDMETARQQGHRLKGSARSFGFPEIGQAGEDLERASAAGDPPAARAAWLRARDWLALARRQA